MTKKRQPRPYNGPPPRLLTPDEIESLRAETRRSNQVLAAFRAARRGGAATSARPRLLTPSEIASLRQEMQQSGKKIAAIIAARQQEDEGSDHE